MFLLAITTKQFILIDFFICLDHKVTESEFRFGFLIPFSWNPHLQLFFKNFKQALVVCSRCETAELVNFSAFTFAALAFSHAKGNVKCDYC